MTEPRLAVDGGSPVRTEPFPSWPVWDAADEEAVLSALRSGRWGSRPGSGFVDAFTTRFASFHQARRAIAVSNGTVALEVALRAIGVGPFDEVIIPAYTFVATATSVLSVGAIPVFADILPDTFLMDPDDAARRITPRTKAIIPVHLFGQCCEMDSLMELAGRHGLKVIEDCAQAHMANYKGRTVGSIGDYGCFSFYPTKNLGALGDAGAITTNKHGYAVACRQMRNLGSTVKYIHDIQGTNARMDTLQAAFLLRKFDDFQRVIDEKRTIAAQYTHELDVYHIRNKDPRVRHSYHLYVLSDRNREKICKALAAKGIETILHYPIPFYKSPAFHWLNHLSFPNTEMLANTVFSIPIYASLTQKDIEHVIQSVRDETPHSSL